MKATEQHQGHEVEAIVGVCRITLRAIRRVHRELAETRDVEAAIRKTQNAQEYFGARLSEIDTRWGPCPRSSIPRVALQLELDAEELREALGRAALVLERDSDCALVALKKFERFLKFETSRVAEDVADARDWLADRHATPRGGPAREAA